MCEYVIKAGKHQGNKADRQGGDIQHLTLLLPMASIHISQFWFWYSQFAEIIYFCLSAHAKMNVKCKKVIFAGHEMRLLLHLLQSRHVQRNCYYSMHITILIMVTECLIRIKQYLEIIIIKHQAHQLFIHERDNNTLLWRGNLILHAKIHGFDMVQWRQVWFQSCFSLTLGRQSTQINSPI